MFDGRATAPAGSEAQAAKGNAMTTTEPTPLDLQPTPLDLLRERLVAYALAHTLVSIRYVWRGDFFHPLVIGRIAVVQANHIAVVVTIKADVRIIPVEGILCVAPLPSRRRKHSPSLPAPFDTNEVQGDGEEDDNGDG